MPSPEKIPGIPGIPAARDVDGFSEAGRLVGCVQPNGADAPRPCELRHAVARERCVCAIRLDAPYVLLLAEAVIDDQAAHLVSPPPILLPCCEIAPAPEGTPHGTSDSAPNMRIIREPTVYLVGRQSVDDVTGPLPRRSRRSLADAIPKWPAKTCRKSRAGSATCRFAKPRPGGNKAYLEPHPRSRSWLGPGTCGLELSSSPASAARCTHELDSPSGGIRLLAAESSVTSMNRWRSTSSRTCIADDPELHEIWLDAVAHSHQAYMKLVEKLQEVFKTSRTARCGASWPGKPPAASCPTPRRRRSS